MSKTKRNYNCQQCGVSSPQWVGKCAGCGAWNTLIEEAVIVAKARSPRLAGYAAAGGSVVTRLSDVSLQQEARIDTQSQELNRVLGGGLVQGSVVLIGGDPGIGKSTLLLQTLTHISQQESALYVTGEESLQQVKMRASRLQLAADDLQLYAETQVEKIIEVAE